MKPLMTLWKGLPYCSNLPGKFSRRPDSKSWSVQAEQLNIICIFDINCDVQQAYTLEQHVVLPSPSFSIPKSIYKVCDDS
jgi:hypothetical protein